MSHLASHLFAGRYGVDLADVASSYVVRQRRRVMSANLAHDLSSSKQAVVGARYDRDIAICLQLA